MVKNWSRNTLELRGDETLVLHRVDVEIAAMMMKSSRGVASVALRREFIYYKTSMITDEDPLRGLLFY